MSMAYTVALCTHNQANRLQRTLVDLAQLKPPRGLWELLIIDNGCHDSTPDLLTRHIWPDGWQVRVVRENTLGLSNARNRAIASARGDYVIFMDDDETPDPDWLCAFERLIWDKRPDAFGGRIRVLFEDARPPWLTDEILGFLGELNRADTVAPLTEPHTSFYGGNFGVHVSVCRRIGNFDTFLGRKGANNTGGEEVDFYRRLLDAGMKVWWTPDAIIYHRILASKLRRNYFLDLHFRQGWMEATRQRGDGPRIPPNYIWGQLFRAVMTVWSLYRQSGRNSTLRKEMNVVYFVGQIWGWSFGRRAAKN